MDADSDLIYQVKVFTRNGDFVDCFGQQGTEQGQLLVPVDAAVDELTGNVAVCEYHNNRVSIFSPGFSFLYTVGTFGEDIGQFKHPSGVAYLPDGKLAVVDQGNFRIQVRLPNPPSATQDTKIL
jgi:DNA-binding beta-propeller fold protein YncE